jgi:hypothetical protein
MSHALLANPNLKIHRSHLTNAGIATKQTLPASFFGTRGFATNKGVRWNALPPIVSFRS